MGGVGGGTRFWELFEHSWPEKHINVVVFIIKQLLSDLYALTLFVVFLTLATQARPLPTPPRRRKRHDRKQNKFLDEK